MASELVISASQAVGPEGPSGLSGPPPMASLAMLDISASGSEAAWEGEAGECEVSWVGERNELGGKGTLGA